MLRQAEIERMRKAIERNVVGAIETDRGSCVAVDDETGKEYGHKWRGGEARVYVEPDEDDEEKYGHDYVFAIQVVLVAVEPE